MTTPFLAFARNSFVCSFLAFCLVHAMPAQTAHFSGVFSTIGSGFNYPAGVAVDGAGNVFVADINSSAVYEIVAVNGRVSSSSTVATVGSGFNTPDGVAVDHFGNVFVSDTDNNAVKEIVAVNGSVSSSSMVITVGSGFANPFGVAVDSAGDVFVSDLNHNAVKEIVAVSGVVSSGSTVITVGSGFSNPTGVAVDRFGNVFVADYNNNAVEEIMAVSGAVSSSSTVNTVGNGFGHPYGVAVDSTGNIYVADYNNSAVKKIVAVSGIVSSSSSVDTIGSDFSYPQDVAVDSADNIVVADSSNGAVKEIMFQGVNFGSLPVATGTPTTLSLTFAFDTGGTIRTPAVLTQGAAGLDFTDAGTGTCTTNGTSHVYSAGATCMVDVTLTPKLSGVRYGAATLSSSAGTIATAYVYGAGAGPQVIFAPGTVSTISSGFNDATSVVVTSGGNVFVADDGSNAVDEIVAVNGAVTSASTVNIVGSGFIDDNGVAVDSAGNVFVADSGNNAVKEIVAVNGVVTSSSTVTTVGSGFNYPDGVAVDKAGNVFVSDDGNNAIKEIVAVNGVVTSSSTVTTVGSGFYIPVAVAVDIAGNVFVGDSGNNAVKEIVAVNGVVTSTSTVKTVGSGFIYPWSVAVDSAGDVFVVDRTGTTAKEIVAVNGVVTSSSAVKTLGSGFSGPNGVAVDSSGNVFVADSNNGMVKKIDLADPPSLSFASTTVGSTSSDSPQIVTVTNYGNEPLTFEVPSTGLNPSVAANFAFGNSSTCPQLSTGSSAATLAAGASCTNLISFMPTVSGSISGSSVSTDNALNTAGPAYATQTIVLSGTATDAPLTVSTTVASTSLTQSHAATAFTPVTASGGTGTLTYSVSPILPSGMSFSAAGTISGNPTALSAATTYTVTVTDSVSATATATFSLKVDAAITATTAASSTVLTQNHAATAFTPVGASGGTAPVSYSVSPTLPVGLSISSAGVISGTPTVVSGAGTYTVTITDANGAAATSTFSLSVNSALIASSAVAATVLTQNHAATAFTPITVTGGTGSLTFSVSPALSHGLVFSGTGTVSGRPTLVSTATSYTVTVTDSDGATTTATFSITVNSAVTAAVAISSTVLTVGGVATAFTPVTASGGTGTLTYSMSPALPAGLVFAANGTVSGTPTLASAVMTYVVTVTDTNGATSTATFSLTVNIVITATSTAVSSSSLTPRYGATVMLTATVAPAPTDAPPGTARFYTGSTLLGTAALSSSGVTTLSISLPLGLNAITAVYSGSASYAGSTSSALSVSDRTVDSLTFSASPTTQLYNNPIMLTAQATSATAGTLTGTVIFMDGTTAVATVPLGATGQASYSVATLADGSHSLTAVYSGDPSFQPSASTGAAVAITVGDVNLNLEGSQNKSVLPGSTAAYTFPVSPLVTPTFLYDVHLTATGLPTGATYTFSPAVIPEGSTSLPVTLTVQTAKGTASHSTPKAAGRNSSRGRSVVAFAFLLPLFGAKSVRRR